MKVVIAGTRTFDDLKLLSKICDKLLKNAKNVTVLCGEARGADSLGKVYAYSRGYKVDFYPANWNDTHGKPKHELAVGKNGKEYWKKAGLKRNIRMAKDADAVIIFWDGKSNGSRHMRKQARRMNVPYRVYNYVTGEFLKR